MTVFFALIFTVLLSFILSVLEGVKIGATKLKAECSFSVAANSVLGEYHIELLNQYDLFYVDTSYLTDAPDYHNVEMRFWDYLDKNFQGEILSTELVGITLATDCNGVFFRKQVSDYMKDKIGLSYIEEMTAMYEEVSVKGFLDEKEDTISQQSFNNQEDISEETWQIVETQFSYEEAKNVKKSFALESVVKEGNELSKKWVDVKGCVSQRECIVGTGKNRDIDFLDKIYFMEYVFEKMSHYSSVKKQGILDYEIEYLLGGDGSDYTNLSSVVKQLLLLREGSNLLYLASDKEKMSLIKEFSTAVALLTLCPEVEPILTASIVAAWSYIESKEDVRILLDGGKIPLFKTKSTWNTDLDSAISLSFFSSAQKECEEGMGYEEYLKLLFLFSEDRNLTYRALDIIEMNVRNTDGNETFRMDGCAEDFVVNIIFDIPILGSYQIVRKFGYFS